ncbi:MAG TPA: hypothetical protein VF940_19300, partial [Streptosporangiaceae bacterium]
MVLTAATLAGVALIAAATLAGAWLGWRSEFSVLDSWPPTLWYAELRRVPLPAAAAPILTSLVAGVLLRAALAAWQLRPARQHP